MALHGLGEMTLGVPRLSTRHAASTPSSDCTSRPQASSPLPTVAISCEWSSGPTASSSSSALAASDDDDVARVRAAAAGHDLDVTEHDDGSISVLEPVVGIRARVAVRDAIRCEPYESPIMNSPGNTPRPGERAPAIFDQGPARPRRLGHVLYGTPDLDGSMRFLQEVLGFELSDLSPGVIAFLRCSEDHHNVGLIGSAVPFFHHSSWQVNDVDEIGKGAENLLAVDPSRNVWGLGRHFLGSNLFWYFRDPAGNFAEYFADLDQIPVAAEWEARQWEPDKALYAWSSRTAGLRRSEATLGRSRQPFEQVHEGRASPRADARRPRTSSRATRSPTSAVQIRRFPPTWVR